MKRGGGYSEMANLEAFNKVIIIACGERREVAGITLTWKLSPAPEYFSAILRAFSASKTKNGSN